MDKVSIDKVSFDKGSIEMKSRDSTQAKVSRMLSPEMLVMNNQISYGSDSETMKDYYTSIEQRPY